MANKTVVVLGGGISGLSAAYYLNKFCSHLNQISKIIVLESSFHLGGWLKTHTFDDGVKHELGPRTLRAATNPGYNALTLAEEIGLSDEVIGTANSSLVSKKRFILVDNELVVLPNRILDLFIKRKPFPNRLIHYVLKDLKTPKVDLSQFGDNKDISVYDFISHRVGPEVADYFFDPLCRGITAGNAKKLSLISLFPQMLRGEQETGSIIKGSLLNSKRDEMQTYSSELVDRAKAWSTYTFKDGLQALPDQLCQYMLALKGNPVEIYNQSVVNKIDFNKTTKKASISVKTAEDSIELEADYIFSAIPSHSLANILPQTECKDLCDALKAISYVDMAVVNLEFKGKVMADDSGFGFLVPSREKSKILGCVYDSCVTPEFNAGHDITRLTIMIGGEWFEEVLGDVNTVDEQSVLNVALEAVRRYLKITSDPIRHIVSINKNCIPQYYLGHRHRIERIDELIRKHALNMVLVGSSYQGFSVPDCIFNSKLAADSFSNFLMRTVSSQTISEPSLQRKSIQ